jgi:hypothetical protein
VPLLCLELVDKESHFLRHHSVLSVHPDTVHKHPRYLCFDKSPLDSVDIAVALELSHNGMSKTQGQSLDATRTDVVLRPSRVADVIIIH